MSQKPSIFPAKKDLFRLLNYDSRLVSSNFSHSFIGFFFHTSDPDDTFCGHKGYGFQEQIMEMYSEDNKETVLNLITHAEVEPFHNCDIHSLNPAIESAKAQKMMSELVSFCSLCGNNDNTHKADEMEGEIVLSLIGGANQGALHVLSLSEIGRISPCPQYHLPVKTRKRKVCCGAAFKSL
jgi:hypothetical protein